MILSTTGSLDGVQIQEYLGPVSAHVVLGANIFSDIAASWRDVFGGRSQSYQKQLQRLTDVVLSELEAEAKALRANAVVGLKLDYSDISGGGKLTMLMVVASGTAVVTSQPDNASVERSRRVVDQEEVQLFAEQEKAVSKFLEDEYPAGDALLELTKIRAANVAEEVFAKYGDRIHHQGSYAGNYFAVCLEERGYRWALDLVINMPFGSFSKLAVVQVSNHDDFRLSDLRSYVDKPMTDRIALLAISEKSQQFYTEEDVSEIDALSREIRESYPDTSKIVEQKTFTGKTKEVRQCSCGGTIEEVGNRCDKCGLNRWGMKTQSHTPDISIHELQTKLRALKQAFQKST